MILELLHSVTTIIKSKIGYGANIDNAVFKLHYRMTTSALFVFCLLITAYQLIGSPINCITDPDAVPENVMNTYCWIHTTFSVKKHFTGQIGHDVPYHGVGHHVAGEDTVVYRAYYQWVPFVLFLQGVMFYAPHWLWKMWEGGKLGGILTGLLSPMLTAEEMREKTKLLVEYLAQSFHLNNVYAIRFYICEALNFVNVVGNIYFVNKFLGGSFLTYGTDVLNFTEMEPEDRGDPMILLFPRLTKCTFHKFGPSGTIQVHDSICVLALNILNEKIYIFIWFWFILLATITALFLVYRGATLFVPTCRLYVLRARSNLVYRQDLKVILDRSEFGDYFLLYCLSRNLDPLVFNQVVKELSARLEKIRSPEEMPLMSKSA